MLQQQDGPEGRKPGLDWHLCLLCQSLASQSEAMPSGAREEAAMHGRQNKTLGLWGSTEQVLKAAKDPPAAGA